ncbi:unnamed protein product [Arabidopsis halleri]
MDSITVAHVHVLEGPCLASRRLAQPTKAKDGLC